MWLIFCILLLYLSIGVTIIQNLNRGDYDVFDRYERELLNHEPDRGSITRDFKENRREAINMLPLIIALWPLMIYFYHQEIKTAREKLVKETAHR